MAGVVVSGAQVSYISQDCEEIPEFLGRKYGHMAKRLDLSFNLLRSQTLAAQLLIDSIGSSLPGAQFVNRLPA
ncbi:leucine-rich repeat-containing protein C10orf11 [Willisornis vidua]|uniref:Leucine-rich repeat-containing protein C10orf11 n=1 Tax=Willisornis vidua TaxID=1566151 RepID=A0ABQ9DBZ3_9PASS|nr:leucine-rich repeat-containing protein C10orf11 [Willisornis vidua]